MSLKGNNKKDNEQDNANRIEFPSSIEILSIEEENNMMEFQFKNQG